MTKTNYIHSILHIKPSNNRAEHNLGWVHLDIKPNGELVDFRGEVSARRAPAVLRALLVLQQDEDYGVTDPEVLAHLAVYGLGNLVRFADDYFGKTEDQVVWELVEVMIDCLCYANGDDFLPHLEDGIDEDKLAAAVTILVHTEVELAQAERLRELDWQNQAVWQQLARVRGEG